MAGFMRLLGLLVVAVVEARASTKGKAAAMQPKKAEAEPTAVVVEQSTMADILLASSISTAFADAVMHPQDRGVHAFPSSLLRFVWTRASPRVDTVKTVQQAEGLGLFAAIKKLGASGSIAPFYEGVGVYALADGIGGAIKFATYEKCKTWCKAHVPEDHLVAASFASAAVAFVACSVVLVPGELLKQRLQAGMYPSLLVGVKELVTQDGLRGMYTGYGATCLRDVPYTMLELGLYDLFKAVVLKARRKEQSDTGDELFAAAVTGGLTGLLTNPLDVVKTQLMTAKPGALAGPLAATRVLFKKGGVDAFLVGSVARVAWLMPFTTIYFGCYEVAKRGLINCRRKKPASLPLPALPKRLNKKRSAL